MTEKFWDKEDVYDNQISPLMTQIIAICKEHNVPMVAQFQFRNDEEEGPGLCTTTLPIEGFACEKIRRIGAAMQPERPICIAETIEKLPGGVTKITSRRIS